MNVTSSVRPTPTRLSRPTPGSPQTPEVPADQVSVGSDSSDAKPTKKWTVMLWSASDNNLYSYMQKDIDECEQVGCTDQLNVLCETDHSPQWFGQVKRYELHQDDAAGIHSPVKGKFGKADMADPKRLSDFIQWGIKNYPAENYALIISDHGAGWQGACSDDGSDSWMTLPMLEQGLQDAREKSGRKLDVVGFDACLMASAEVAHQLRNETSFLVGSQETEGGAGWQYNRVLSKDMLSSTDMNIRTKLDFTPREMASNIVSMAQGHQQDLATMTAFDTSKIAALTDSVKQFGEAVLDSSLSSQQLRQAKNQTQGFYEFYDLHDFASKVAARAGNDARLTDSAKAVQSAIADAIVAEQHSSRYPGAHGVTIELNRQDSSYKPGSPSFSADQNQRVDFGRYANTAFEQETGWSQVQNKING